MKLPFSYLLAVAVAGCSGDATAIVGRSGDATSIIRYHELKEEQKSIAENIKTFEGYCRTQSEMIEYYRNQIQELPKLNIASRQKLHDELVGLRILDSSGILRNEMQRYQQELDDLQRQRAAIEIKMHKIVGDSPPGRTVRAKLFYAREKYIWDSISQSIESVQGRPRVPSELNAQHQRRISDLEASIIKFDDDVAALKAKADSLQKDVDYHRTELENYRLILSEKKLRKESVDAEINRLAGK